MPGFERRRWSVRGGAARARELLRDEGARGLVDRVLSQLGVHRLIVLEQRLGEGAAASEPASGRAPAGLSFGEAGEGDLDALAALRAADHASVTAAMARPYEPVEQLLRRQLARGDRCFVARLGQRIVAVAWVARGEIPVRYLLCDLLLEPGDGYVYDVFVAEALRSRGIVTALYRHVAGALSASGCEHALMLVRVHNAANLRAAERAGYRRRGVIRCIAIGERALHSAGETGIRLRPWPG